jgi:hypothetical protein
MVSKRNAEGCCYAVSARTTQDGRAGLLAYMEIVECNTKRRSTKFS